MTEDEKNIVRETALKYDEDFSTTTKFLESILSKITADLLLKGFPVDKYGSEIGTLIAEEFMNSKLGSQ